MASKTTTQQDPSHHHQHQSSLQRSSHNYLHDVSHPLAEQWRQSRTGNSSSSSSSGGGNNTASSFSSSSISTTSNNLGHHLMRNQTIALSRSFARLLLLLSSSSDSSSSSSTPTTTQAIILLLDIEGTVTPLPFVTRVLYPASDRGLPVLVKQAAAQHSSSSPSASSPSALSSSDMELFLRCWEEASQEARSSSGSSLTDGLTFLPDPSGERQQEEPTRSAEQETGVKTLSSASSLLTPDSFVTLLARRSETNSKVGYLKQLQGLVWRQGYEQKNGGTIHGHVFKDAADAIRSWSHCNSQAAAAPTTTTTTTTSFPLSPPLQPHLSTQIYSSGSIAAQKLLFAHSTSSSSRSSSSSSDGNNNDMTVFLEGYHDPSTVGLKTVAESYGKLRANAEEAAAAVAVSASASTTTTPSSSSSSPATTTTTSTNTHSSDIITAAVFLTDSVAEVEAACASSTSGSARSTPKSIDLVIFLLRPLNARLSSQDLDKLEALSVPVVFSFSQVTEALERAIVMASFGFDNSNHDDENDSGGGSGDGCESTSSSAATTTLLPPPRTIAECPLAYQWLEVAPYWASEIALAGNGSRDIIDATTNVSASTIDERAQKRSREGVKL